MYDQYQRKIDYLRISITDRCNLKCTYCMPNEDIKFLPREELLTAEEMVSIVKAFVDLGVTKVKITGGEPLLHPDILMLIKSIKEMAQVKEVSLTTNGVLLESMLDELKAAGLDSINVSLDTLDRKKYQLMTKRDQLDRVLHGIKMAVNAGLKVKINCVLIKEINGSDIIELVELARYQRVHVRFIELMPIGHAKHLTPISEQEVVSLLKEYCGDITPFNETLGNGPAHYYELPQFLGKIGFISAVSHRFCSTCNRVRVTSEGYLKTCLHFKKGINLKPLINTPLLEKTIQQCLQHKPKNHHFNEKETTDEVDERYMSQIGG